jgi:hypothetical protein
MEIGRAYESVEMPARGGDSEMWLRLVRYQFRGASAAVVADRLFSALLQGGAATVWDWKVRGLFDIGRCGTNEADRLVVLRRPSRTLGDEQDG